MALGAIVLVLGGLVLIASFAFELGDTHREPEHVVISYYIDLDDGDAEDAARHVAGQYIGEGEGGTMMGMFGEQMDLSVSDVQRVSLEDGTAIVDANVELYDTQSGERVTFGMRHELKEQDDEWLLVSVDGKIIDVGG